MTCKEYIYQLTSGQLRQAPFSVKLEARMHRIICKYCRAFTRNDDQLDKIITGYREFKVEKEQD